MTTFDQFLLDRLEGDGFSTEDTLIGMLPLIRQVQIACDIAGRGPARLAGTEPVSVADSESSFDELQGRIRHTLETLNGYHPDQIDGNEQREIRLVLRMQVDGLSTIVRLGNHLKLGPRI